MHGHRLLHKMLLGSLGVHAKRIDSVVNATQALLIGKQLTVTQLGRFSQGVGKERHNIRKVDRLIGNNALQKELPDFYRLISQWLLNSQGRAVINVDWSATDKRKDWHILRASVALKGRSFTIYQEVHGVEFLNNREVQQKFLKRLAGILPIGMKAIIVTDAGFCNPWFKEVTRLGFDWIGRTKTEVTYQRQGNNHWQKCGNLYAKAKTKATEIESLLLTKKNPLKCRLVLYKEPLKGRIHKTRGGKKSESTHSRRVAKRQRTPWVLVTSLTSKFYTASQVVKMYKRRMQIEEDFRDTKSTRYGFSLRNSLSKSAERIQVLLLIAVLASFVCWILSINAREKNEHYAYQANTVKDVTVLSAIFLGCQLVRKGASITYEESKRAIKQLRYFVKEAVL